MKSFNLMKRNLAFTASLVPLLVLALVGRPLLADEVILLPDEDGVTGAIFFSDGGSTTELDEPRERVQLGLLGRLKTTASEAYVQEGFGNVLSIVVGQDDPLDTLPEIVNLTLATHPLTMQMAHERQARDQYTREAYSNLFPRLNVRGEIGEEWTRDPFTRQFEDDFVDLARREIEVNLRQTLPVPRAGRARLVAGLGRLPQPAARQRPAGTGQEERRDPRELCRPNKRSNQLRCRTRVGSRPGPGAPCGCAVERRRA
jgi:hypothetical protein